MEAIDIDYSLVLLDEFDALYVPSPFRIPSYHHPSSLIPHLSPLTPYSLTQHKMSTATLDHNTFRCRTRGLLHSAVSAAVAVVFSLPLISRFALTNVANRNSSVEVNTVPEPDNKDDESLKKYPGEFMSSMCPPYSLVL